MFKDVHEPIIPRDYWQLIQETMKGTKRTKPRPHNGEKSMFCNILYCADCGSKMWYNVNHGSRDIPHFKCSNYKGYRGTCEKTHHIRVDSLEMIVKNELRRLLEYFEHDTEEFQKIVEQKVTSNIAKKRNLLKQTYINPNHEMNNYYYYLKNCSKKMLLVKSVMTGSSNYPINMLTSNKPTLCKFLKLKPILAN